MRRCDNICGAWQSWLSVWRITKDSMVANVVPAFVLWLFAVTLAVVYCLSPWMRDALDHLSRWQERNGWLAAFLSQFLFCGLVPCVFLLTVRSIVIDRPIVKSLVQSIWCGAMGMACWWFYGLQCKLFGTGHDIATLLCKTAFDQFVWTVVVVAPLSSVFYVWLGHDFSIMATVKTCRTGFVRRVVMPNLVANWGVWIPVVMMVYTLPRSLQIHMLSIVSSLWVLIGIQIGTRTANPVPR